MKKLIWLAGVVALISSSGCCSWCDRWCSNRHTAAAPAQYAPTGYCVPCTPAPVQCCPTPAPACCQPTAGYSPVSGNTWQRPPAPPPGP